MHTTSIVRHLDALASILDYPGGTTLPEIHETAAVLSEEGGDVRRCVEQFLAGIEGQDIPGLEETYTRTFDISPLCCLECGWHLFGESYDRGGFLVEMRTKLRELGVEETTELPDHLSALLRLQGRLIPEEATVFADKRLKVAVQKMIDGFGDGKSPYRFLLEATSHLLESCFPSPEGTEVRNVQ
jgi:nitrate reductase molybdenum cofactor assembly chaperone